MSPLLTVHVAAGSLGILSGAASMGARKGSRLHVLTGKVFAASMTTMGLAGALVALTRWMSAGHAYQVGNFLMGLFTAYLTITGWETARRTRKGVGARDRVWLIAGGMVAASFLAVGIGTAGGASWLQHGLGAPFFFVMGAIAILATIGDFRLFARGVPTGPLRLRRHLWRMCTAMLIAALSFFIGQSKVLPLWLLRGHINTVPVLLTALYLLFWLVRTRARVVN